jgi:hypothetical protein
MLTGQRERVVGAITGAKAVLGVSASGVLEVREAALPTLTTVEATTRLTPRIHRTE